ncbi:hypothetical protein M0805_004393 [Coniferiporia weirii]|nr:hypothetical protein M0805_004393 [Coniferiporia weirii]
MNNLRRVPHARRVPLSRRPTCCRQPARYNSTSSSSSPPPPNPQGRGGIKGTHAVAIALAVSTVAFATGALYPPPIASLLSPRPTAPPPPPNSPEAAAATAALESQLQSLPFLAALRASPASDEWYETRPYTALPPERLVHSLTAGALRAPGRLALAPLVRARRDESEAVVILHFGSGLCGHEGIVHGGLVATVLDESLGRLAIMNTPEKVAVTATLSVHYKAPTRADQFVVIRTRLVERKGRKAYVEGTLEDLNGNVLASAEALFVQPKYAKLLNVRPIREALGEPPAVSGALVSGGDPAPVRADPVQDRGGV